MAESTKLDMLAIAAHPDDIEITCGGLMIKMVKQGRATGALDLTQGEMGTLGDENDRAAEADRAAKVMGLSFRQNLKLPDSAIEYNQENKLKIAAVIRATQPELVILPHWEQRHPDHVACSKLGYDACFLAGLKKIDIEGEPFRPRKIIYVSYYRNTDYSFMVDVSDEYEQKIEAVMAYHSQFGNPVTTKHVFQPGFDIVNLMKTRMRAIGHLVVVEYAEAYTIKENILINDPQKMPVQSV